MATVRAEFSKCNSPEPCFTILCFEAPKRCRHVKIKDQTATEVCHLTEKPSLCERPLTIRCDITVYLMSPNFLVMALPSVLKAAEVLCPAVVSVSDVFLYLRHMDALLLFPPHTELSCKLSQYPLMHANVCRCI